MWQGWTDDKIETLRMRWAAGDSCQIIANEIGAPSRNAVIGKAYRMGLIKRTTYQRKPKSPRPKRQATRIKPKTGSLISLLRADATPLPPPPPHVTDIPRVSMNDITPHQCRWPCAGFTTMTAPMYCGCENVPGVPYCENHARRAYAAAQPATSAKSYRQLAVKGSRLAVGKVFAF